MRIETKEMNDIGLKGLIQKGKKQFRIEENLNYYSPEDLKRAEKMFIKACILSGRCEL